MMRIANRDNLIYPELSYKITGLLFETQNSLGRFCGEKQYGDFLEQLLIKARVKYERELALPQMFEGEKRRNIVDFLINNKIVVELKAKRIVTKEDYYQLKKYLVSLNLKLGILVNFRDKYLKPIRVLNSAYSDSQLAD